MYINVCYIVNILLHVNILNKIIYYECQGIINDVCMKFIKEVVEDIFQNNYKTNFL